MFISEIKNILDAQTLRKIFNNIREAKFVDGRISGGTERDKYNQELFPESEKYLDVLRVIELGVRENPEFNLTAFPRYMTRPIISRYEVGMFYKGHVDKPVMNFMETKFDLMSGHFSHSYCRELDAGSAVVYPTGRRHQVMPLAQV